MRAGEGASGLWICSSEPNISAFVFCLLCLLLLLLPYYALCITCLKLSNALCGSHGATAVVQQVCVDHYLLCVCRHSIRMCVLCVCNDARYVCACVGVCRPAHFCCWNPTFQLLHFVCSGRCCCCCIMSSVSHASISLLCGSHGTTAVAQQVVWTTSMRVLT